MATNRIIDLINKFYFETFLELILSPLVAAVNNGHP